MNETERLSIVSDGVLSIAEAAKELRVCKETISRMVRAGTLLCCKVGRRKLIPRKALALMLAESVN